jgi:inner membrane protein
MENLTHSLIGLVAGEAMARCTAPDPRGLPAPVRRNALIAISIVGSNLPDVDLAWSMQFVTGDRMGYLLHHRGHTHTLLGCLALAALLLMGTWLWHRHRHRQWSASDLRTLSAMALLAVLLHLGMDALNSYGVHPFWPWDNRWRYGDRLFIIEPLYWLAAAPLLLVLQRWPARLALGLALLAASVLLKVAHTAMPWWSLPLPALLLILLGWRMPQRGAVLTSVALCVLLTAVFATAGTVATRKLDALAATSFPAWRTLDHVLAPAPANPLCWDVLLLQQSGDEYVVRRAQLSVLPQVSVDACSFSRQGDADSLFTRRVDAARSDAVRWNGEYVMSRALLVQLAGSSCTVRELMQFARVPFAVTQAGNWVLGDVRFDTGRGGGMTEVTFTPGSREMCRHDLPWVPPRADVLGLRSD